MSNLFNSKTMINGIDADLLRAIAECKEDHNKRQKAEITSVVSIPVTEWNKVLGLSQNEYLENGSIFYE